MCVWRCEFCHNCKWRSYEWNSAINRFRPTVMVFVRIWKRIRKPVLCHLYSSQKPYTVSFGIINVISEISTHDSYVIYKYGGGSILTGQHVTWSWRHVTKKCYAFPQEHFALKYNLRLSHGYVIVWYPCASKIPLKDMGQVKLYVTKRIYDKTITLCCLILEIYNASTCLSYRIVLRVFGVTS